MLIANDVNDLISLCNLGGKLEVIESKDEKSLTLSKSLPNVRSSLTCADTLVESIQVNLCWH